MRISLIVVPLIVLWAGLEEEAPQEQGQQERDGGLA
jgi:hypothetical protein